MAETQYSIIKAAQPKAPPRNLIKISGDRDIVASLEAFGPSTFGDNIQEMRALYSHPQTGQIINFRAPTTAESGIIASCDFPTRAKKNIFDPNWLQAGPIVRAKEGFFVNPPKDAKGNFVTDEETLKSYLNETKSIRVNNGDIYVVPDNETLKDFGYAEYGTFKQGVQKGREFAESGLARVLEHTKEESARYLGEISDSKVYKLGVNVRGFDSVKDPVLMVVGLYSNRNSNDYRLGVFGDGWCGKGGFAFGVLDPSAEGASQKS